jgi:hypothetical protein
MGDATDFSLHKSSRALKGPAKIKGPLRGLHLDLTTDSSLQQTSESRIILIVSPLSVYDTTSNRLRWERPKSMKRASDIEWSGSGIVMDSVSAHTDVASWNETPCFLRFESALRWSHSNRNPMAGPHENVKRTLVKIMRLNNITYLCSSNLNMPLRIWPSS